MTKRAIISLYDKSKLVFLARGLVNLGWEIIASGGTARAIREAKLTVRDVSEITGSPEILGGRVKTLHPAIHGAILARNRAGDEADLAAQKIAMIDLVACNLYPFADTVARQDVTLDEAVEQIDIGGVTLLRAAAKNFKRVTVISDPSDYEWVLNAIEQGSIDFTQRKMLATKAFAHTRDYDTAIVNYLEGLL